VRKRSPLPLSPAGPSDPWKPRCWYDPTEGLLGLQGWRDYLIAAGLGLFAFILSFVNYWLPNQKVFDEIYFSKAGEEYLTRQPIWENTHPPLTKLIITLSMVLFGGMHRLGDTPWGWRFGDVVFGALVVVLVFAFGKRLTGSTAFAAIAALLLTFDGMHFVQSRIATPEGIVVFFSLAAVYAFYRFWIAEQVSLRRFDGANERYGAIACAGLAIAIGFCASWAIVNRALGQSAAATVVLGMYAALGSYLALRLAVLPRFFGGTAQEIGYAEGSFAIREPSGTFELVTADGGQMSSSGKTLRRGIVSQAAGGGLRYDAGELQIAYGRDGVVHYTTPVGAADYSPEVIRAGDRTQRGRDARFWLIAFSIALGCLVASKWYGVMGFGVSFVVLSCVWLQRFWNAGRRPALWGNPRGYRLDVALVAVTFIAATVYGLSWAEDLRNQADVHSASDVMLRQYSMFEYHEHLNDRNQNQHPYASQWWQWPLDLRPIWYYGSFEKNERRVIYTLPNPINLWFGLFCVPYVGYLAWRERRKGYALIVLTYLLQWLPWMRSPRITFSYHFYVDIPLICLCNAIVLQRVWDWSRRERSWYGPVVVVGFVAAVGVTFVFFYPILAGTPIPDTYWRWTQWLPSWT
jgi:dolichyl-phosphate-mannose--protein O-mannosyl transferase